MAYEEETTQQIMITTPNEEIVTVYSRGIVTIHSAGIANITAETVGYRGENPLTA